MRRAPIFALISVLFLAVLLQNPMDEKTVYFSSDGRNVTLLVKIADTEQARIKGLMFVESLDKNKGMLFVFPGEAQRTFWMKNTLIPLDMIFIGSNGTVVSVIGNATACEKDPCETYSSKYPAKYVVEVNADFAKENNISAGNVLELNDLYKTGM